MKWIKIEAFFRRVFYRISFIFPGTCSNCKGLFLLKPISERLWVDEWKCKKCGTVYLRGLK